MYDSFITLFEARLNQVKLAKLVSLIADSLNNPPKALEFVEKVLKGRNRLGVEAAACLDMDIVITLLKIGDSTKAKVVLDSTGAILPSISSTEATVFSKYYLALAEYKKVGKASICIVIKQE